MSLPSPTVSPTIPMSASDLANKLKARFDAHLSAPTEFRGEWTMEVADAANIPAICAFAKTDLGFDYLLDITSIDEYGTDPRWTVVYELSGLGHRQQLRLKTRVSEAKSELPTVTGVW